MSTFEQVTPAHPLSRFVPSRYVLVKCSFWAFVLLYCCVILYKPSFGIIDDHGFLTTVLHGKALPLYINASSGRFVPLENQEYNVASIFSASPLSFYLVNAVELVLTAWLLVKLGQIGSANRRKSLPYLVAILVMLTPDFMIAWFRLQVPEKTEFLLLGLFLYCYLKFQANPRFAYYAVGMVAAGTALLFKETAFVIIGAFGASHLLLGRQLNKFNKLFDISLITLSGLWLSLYYFLMYRHRGAHVYGDTSDSGIYRTAKTLASNFLHDPVAIAGLVFILGIRACLLVKRNVSYPVFDSALLASGMLCLAYLALRMGNDYYLLPIYIFVPYIVSIIVDETSLRGFFKPWIVAIFILLLISQLSFSAGDAVLWKLAPANFQLVLNRLDEVMTSSPKRVRVFIAGANRGTGVELYVSLERYLAFRGLSDRRYDLLSDLPVNEAIPFEQVMKQMPASSLSYRIPSEADHVGLGDYVLLTPYDSLDRRREFGNSGHYSLVYKTRSVTFPDFSIKALIDRKVLHGRLGFGSRLIDPNYYLYERLQ